MDNYYPDTTLTEPCKVKETHLTEVIEVVYNEGDGSSAKPFREVRSFWTKDGRLIGELRI